MSEEKATQKETKTTPSRGEKKCSVESCKRPYRAKGYCVVHYQAWRRGEVEGHKARYKICSKEACRKPAGRFGLCDEHRGTASAEAPAAS
jgi:hypothetical protein